MKNVLRIFMLEYIIALSSFSPQAAPAWHSLGLEDDTVNCLYIIQEDLLFAGTNRGLFLKWGENEWLGVPVNGHTLPVLAMVRGSDNRLIVAIGAGTYSDGIYEGHDILDGPPFYAFNSLIDWLVNPGCLTACSSGDTVYAGSGNSVYRSVLGIDRQYGLLEKIKTPVNCFGVEMPFCSDLYISGVFENTLLAGGYDRSPEPGQGHALAGYNDNDSLVVLRDLNVSSISEGVFWEVGPSEIFFGTIDDGIHRLNPISSSEPWTSFDSPDNGPVRDMIAVPTMIFSDALVVAVQSGIFTGIGSGWTEIGDLPAVPNCIYAFEQGLNGVYFAGTEKGVFRYGEIMTGVKLPRKSSSLFDAAAGLEISYSPKGPVAVEYSVPEPCNVRIDVVDAAGREVCGIFQGYSEQGRHTVSWDNGRAHGAGVYFIRLSTEIGNVINRLLLVK